MSRGYRWSKEELSILKNWAADPNNRRWKGIPLKGRSYFAVTQKAKELNIQLIAPQKKTKYDKRYKKPANKTYWIESGLAGCVFKMEPPTNRPKQNFAYHGSGATHIQGHLIING